MRFKTRKAELKQRDKESLAKYVGMFLNDCSYNINLFSQTQNHDFFEFRISSFEFRVTNLKFQI